MTLTELAERLGCRLEGDGTIQITRVAGIEQAQAGDLTFIANAKYQGAVSTTAASAIIVGHEFPVAGTRAAILRADQPYLAFAQAVGLFVPATPPPPGIDPTSAVAGDATIGADVSIGAFVTIGPGAIVGDRSVVYPHTAIGPHARIGADCVIHSQVSVRERVHLGDRVILQDGVVVGSDGFGFAKQSDGTHLKIPQRAAVIIEDDVEVGANSTIDRPAVGETRIGAGTKIDNLVHIGHGVSVGRRVLFAAQVGIAGSTVIEDDVVLAGQVGVNGHIRIGAGAVASGQSGVTNSVGPGEFVSGYPAIPNREWLKSMAVVRQLPGLKKRITELEQRILDLEEKLAACRTTSDR